MKPLHHLDAAHFFSTGGGGSAAADVESPSAAGTPHGRDGVGPRLPAVVGGNVAEEYRLLAAASATRSGAPDAASRHHHHRHRAAAAGYLELLDLDALRVVFLVLDALLLLHRITNVYLGGLVVSRRCDGDALDGRWSTSGPRKAATTVRAPSPAAAAAGATNYVDAGDYLQPNCGPQNRRPPPPPPGNAPARVLLRAITCHLSLAFLRCR